MPLGEVFTDSDGRRRYRCSVCAREWGTSVRADRCCTFQCSGCGLRHLGELDAANCCPQFMCPTCGVNYYDENERDLCEERHEYNEEPDYPDYYEEPPPQFGEITYEHGPGTGGPPYPPEVLSVDPEHILFVDALEGRPSRMCSIEQELTAGGNTVARMLYDLGFSDYYQVTNYGRDSEPHRMIVKEDGSLPHGGGEVVYSRYALSRQDHANDVSKALACINALKRDGHVGIGDQAGTHIHVSALDNNFENLIGPPQMASLYEIFSFAEDVLFRLAASGWPGHRGHSHTQPLVKMDRPTPGKIAQEATHSRYFSLSFTRLLNAARACSCGACIAGGWQDCSCGAIRKGTVEWRIFNATTDPKTIHAWTLLAQGLTAASLDYTLGSLEPNEIRWDTPPAERHAWILGWILWNCPFTDPERQLIIECARQAPRLQIDWGEFDRVHGGWGQLIIPESPIAERGVRPFRTVVGGDDWSSTIARFVNQQDNQQALDWIHQIPWITSENSESS